MVSRVLRMVPESGRRVMMVMQVFQGVQRAQIGRESRHRSRDQVAAVAAVARTPATPAASRFPLELVAVRALRRRFVARRVQQRTAQVEFRRRRVRFHCLFSMSNSVEEFSAIVFCGTHVRKLGDGAGHCTDAIGR